MSLLLSAPWIVVALLILFRVRLPRELPAIPAGAHGSTAGGSGDPTPTGAAHEPPPPLVSVVIPARNEAVNIDACLEGVLASGYPRFEVIVVDDRSDDGTGRLARAHDRGRAERFVVVDGRPLPEAWLGKPWACHQGSLEARGDLILFTDADTLHGPALLSRAAAALEESGAEVVTVVGRQILGSFWERLVQPQIFVTMVFRFSNTEREVTPERWRDAIANGQFLLFRRETYEAIGGHEAVRGEVVEDLRLAQILVRRGRRLCIRRAEDDLATRMYRSLRDLVNGWTKNVVIGGLMTVPPGLRPVVPPVTWLTGVILWLVPPLVLVGSLAAGFRGVSVGGGARVWMVWSAAVTSGSALFWMGVSRRFRIAAGYGLLYPVGAAVGSYIVLRAWLRGRRVEWKGRSYDLDAMEQDAPA